VSIFYFFNSFSLIFLFFINFSLHFYVALTHDAANSGLSGELRQGQARRFSARVGAGRAPPGRE
jgi:hypothetical protein